MYMKCADYFADSFLDKKDRGHRTVCSQMWTTRTVDVEALSYLTLSARKMGGTFFSTYDDECNHS